MPTSATRTSDGAAAVTLTGGRRRAGRSAAGFTLLELLVVVSMVAILLSTVVLGFTGADTEQRLRGEAEQIAYTIEMARQYALQRNREWGLYVDPDSLRFVEFDPEEAVWRTQAARPFGQVEVMEGVELRVESEGVENLPVQDPEDLPAVILFSSGEVTPFTLYMEPSWQSSVWEIHSDGLSRTRAERAEY